MSTPIDESVIKREVKKIVKERGTKWIPDAVEEKVYANAISAILNLADGALNNIKMNFMGHEVTMDIKKRETSTQTIYDEDEEGMKLRNGKVVKRPKLLGVFPRKS